MKCSDILFSGFCRQQILPSIHLTLNCTHFSPSRNSKRKISLRIGLLSRPSVYDNSQLLFFFWHFVVVIHQQETNFILCRVSIYKRHFIWMARFSIALSEYSQISFNINSHFANCGTFPWSDIRVGRCGRGCFKLYKNCMCGAVWGGWCGNQSITYANSLWNSHG